ncbi:MAG TPA: PriCT-2 domain-containing protein, partial [Stellaceae bacterium]|nr:PriCT-2 domain-containing protein [Stellaceae bacterium]
MPTDTEPTAALAPNFNVGQRYVELLTGSPNTPLCWRFLPDSEAEEKRVLDYERAERERRIAAGVDKDEAKSFCLKRNYDGSLSEVWDDLVAHQQKGWGIFAVVNEGGRNGKSITRIRANFIDMDGKLLSSVKFHVEPDFVVKRNDLHWHAYWLVADCHKDDFASAQKRLAKHYGSDPGVHDLPRVLRVPGTKHQKHKNGEPTFVVELIERRDLAWEPRRSLAEIMAGLPELTPEETKVSSSTPTGEPVSEEELRSVLGHIDPDCAYPQWRDAVAAAHNTPMVGDDDETTFLVNEEKRRKAVQDWSRGDLDHQGRYLPRFPESWTDEEAVDQVFDTMPPKEGGVAFGTLVHMAGLGEPPRD